MKKILLLGMAAALWMGSALVCPAQEAAASSTGTMKPVVTVTLSSYDQIVTSLGAINPQAALIIEGAVNSLTANQGLEGLDKKRPLGLLIRTDDQQFPAQLILPVTDLAKLLKSLEPSIGTPKEKDGVYELETDERVFYLKQVGDWAYVSIAADGLSNLPENPIEAFGGLEKQYDLGIRLSVKNVPVIFRQMGLGLMQSAMQAGLEKMPDETDERHAQRVQTVEQSMKQMTQLVNETDTLVIGLKLDGKEGKASLEGVATALDGTEMAKQFAAAKEPMETKFGGFLAEGAALTYVAAQKVPEANIAQIESSLSTARDVALKDLEDQGLSEQDLALAKDLTSQLLDVVSATIKGGKLDLGAAVKLGSDSLTVVAGGHLLDTAKLDGILKKLVAKATADDPKLGEMIKLDAEEYQGIHFHRLAVPLEGMENGEVLQKLVGDNLEVYVGLGPESIYFAGGRDALKVLKEAIDGSKKPVKVPPAQLKLTATPLAKCVAAVAEDAKVKNAATLLGQILEGAPNQDHLTITTTAVPNGVKIRMEMEAGILKVLGVLPMLGAAL